MSFWESQIGEVPPWYLCHRQFKISKFRNSEFEFEPFSKLEDDIEDEVVPGDDTEWFFNQCFIFRLFRDNERVPLRGTIVSRESRCEHMFNCIKESIEAHSDDASFEPATDPAW